MAVKVLNIKQQASFLILISLLGGYVNGMKDPLQIHPLLVSIELLKHDI